MACMYDGMEEDFTNNQLCDYMKHVHVVQNYYLIIIIIRPKQLV